ncbi:hypothetical protein ACFVJ5_07360 [Nocardia sp. NPDC127606]|uniref:hypothetical protein n=1 Tax=Nocardia sp. NPDC127606 TaxID=3345406 RepID=UPI00362AFEA7
MGTLRIVPKEIELIYDQLDTNAINFREADGYFSIQTGVYLEEDGQLDEPQFELNDQGNSQFGGLRQALFSKDELTLEFADDTPFIEKHKTVDVDLSSADIHQVVDFFANHLAMGDIIAYTADFPDADKVEQTEKRALF